MAKRANHGPRTVAEFKRRGWRYGKTEHWKAFHASKDDDRKPGGVRVDLFGFVDYLAIAPAGPRKYFVFVQITSDSGVSARVAKIRGECSDAAKDVLSVGGRIEVWGWKQKKPRARWTLRRVAVLLGDDGELYTEKQEPDDD